MLAIRVVPDGLVVEEPCVAGPTRLGRGGAWRAVSLEQATLFSDSRPDEFLLFDSLLERLTGFDAPIEQVMYIDKRLREHTLLQAIARTNRVKRGKQRGYVVDYIGLANHLTDALTLYTAADELQELHDGLKNITTELPVLAALLPSRGQWACRWVGRQLRQLNKVPKVLITDGPYAETKEQLGGILVLEAKDLNHAIQLMSKHPGVKAGPFEIRPVEDLSAMVAESERRRSKTK